MSSYCFRTQMEGYEELKNIHKTYSEKSFYYKIAYPYCKKYWTKGGVVDTRMLAHCLENEVEGKKDVDYYYTKYDAKELDKLVSTALVKFNSWSMVAYNIRKAID
ncbi:hypothetical protein [Litorilituus lipolyticus]|uniref:Uncharacterized protein n=1 Tax=Litorilituus lipolyticus TaxID=2491017 RepID=A0A502L8L1_9GAMM|nr:hypothetical protein [Litorilituus lipolyticus]TPH19229.1 hypothetical protein EPA86_00430 [Litorilituus lipolyticus]